MGYNLTVTIPLDVYNVLLTRSAQVNAMERFYHKNEYLSKADIRDIFDFSDTEKSLSDN